MQVHTHTHKHARTHARTHAHTHTHTQSIRKCASFFVHVSRAVSLVVSLFVHSDRSTQVLKYEHLEHYSSHHDYFDPAAYATNRDMLESVEYGAKVRTKRQDQCLVSHPCRVVLSSFVPAPHSLFTPFFDTHSYPAPLPPPKSRLTRPPPLHPLQNRMATVFFYLNNVSSGGETNFPRASTEEHPEV